ncbi:MAG: 50S ribosomal protein L13 [Planctomycetes bacterium]|nr:50S ribosomal protein L13 [Planctomycetota bacterium]
MKCYMPTKETAQHNWLLVDADGKVLGRMASKIATILMGKTKAVYAPNVDTGDFVVVINAEKVRLTGNKMETKTYETYSRYPGGQKTIPIKKWLAEHPERVITLAVKRMMPRNNALTHQMLKKLKVYKGSEHPHAAQQPVKLEL